MATNAAYRDMGMDVMERLYYEKQEFSKNAYSNKHRDKDKKKPTSLSNKRKQMRQDSKRFQELLDESNDISLYC